MHTHIYIYIYRYPRLFILIGAPSLNPGVVSPDARVVINHCASGYAAWPCLAWERWRCSWEKQREMRDERLVHCHYSNEPVTWGMINDNFWVVNK